MRLPSAFQEGAVSFDVPSVSRVATFVAMSSVQSDVTPRFSAIE